jgi:ssDNA-specific exonuclease RecJ
VGNKKPVFSMDLYSVNSKPIKQNSPHFSFNTKFIQMLDFNGEKNSKILSLPIEKQVLFELNYSVFRGNESVKGIIKNVCLNLNNLDKIKPILFSNELNDFLYEEQGICVEKQFDLRKGYKTLYAVSNVEALKYNDMGLKVFLYETDLKNSENCIVICPKTVPTGYERVVYLDKPFFVPDFNVECIVNSKSIGNLYIEDLSFGREYLAEIYNYLVSISGKKFTRETEFYISNEVMFNELDFIFACKVFFELGFFTNENGILRKQNKEKTPLTDSKIYTKITNIEIQ